MLVCVLAIGGALLWLRTDSAARFIADTASEQFSAQGLRLQLGQISGTLPQSIHLTDIALADPDGVFFSAQSLTLDTHLLALFAGRLEVVEASVDQPVLYRLPKLPPAPPEPDTEPDSPGGVSIPVGIQVDRVAVRGGVLHAPALRADASPETTYGLELEGSASLRGSALAAKLTLSFLHPDGSGLRIALDLDAASGIAGLEAQSEGENVAAPVTAAAPGEDYLSVDISLREGTGGLLSLLAADPALPPYSFSLRGKGPLRRWTGELALLAGADIHSVITLQCPDGSLWKDLVERQTFTLALRTTLKGGASLPQNLLPLLGDGVRADLTLASAADGYRISLDSHSKAWNVALRDAHIRTADPAASSGWTDAEGQSRPRQAGMLLDAHLEAAVTDMRAILPPDQNSTAPPLRSAGISATLSALLDKDFAGIHASGTLKAGGVAMPQGQGQAPGTEDFSTEYSLTARKSGQTALLDTFTLQGLGITVAAQAKVDLQSLAAQAKADIRAADASPWQDLVGRLSGFATPQQPRPLGGDIALALSLNLPPQLAAQSQTAEQPQSAAQSQSTEQSQLAGQSQIPQRRPGSPASGRLTLVARDMRWPTPQLTGILGPDINAALRLSGSRPKAGQPSFTLKLEKLGAGILSADGAVTLLLPEAPGSSPLADGSLTVALKAEVSNLAPLAAAPGQPAPVSGPLTALIAANGPLKAPHMSVQVSSPAITASGKNFRNLALTLTADGSISDAALGAQGDIRLTLGQSPGGPVNFAGDWRVNMPQKNLSQGRPADGMSLALKNVSLRGAGLELTAALDAALPLAAKGDVKLKVTDWSKLAALSDAPLSGGPANLDLRLDHNGKSQEARLNLRLARLRLKAPNSPPTLVIRDLAANLSASGLPEALNANFSLTLGRGMGGPLRWSSGTASLTGNHNSGELALTLLPRGPAPRRPRKGRAASPAELLLIKASYDLNKMRAEIGALTLWDRRTQTGLALKKPLSLDFARGIQAHGLDMAFQPSGTLTADADILPESLSLKAKLDALPFDFFKLFTPAALPDGALNLTADIATTPTSSRGGFTLKSRVSSTKDVDGMEEATASVFELTLQGALAPSPGAPVARGSGVRQLSGHIWLTGAGTLGDSAKGADAREGRLGFQIPLRLSPGGLPLPDAAAPMAVALNWNGPIDPLWQVAPLPDRYLRGNLDLNLNITGAMNAPKALVKAYLAGGSFEDIPNGVLIKGISLEARNTPQGEVRALVAAGDNQSGNLAVEADITGLSGKPGAKPHMALRGQLTNFSPIHRDDLHIDLSGIFGLKGYFDSLAITSDIVVNKGEFVISNKLGGGVTTLDVVNKKRLEAAKEAQDEEETVVAAGPSLDLRVAIPRYFFVRGMGVNSEWQGALRISGNASAPSLTGTLNPVRGYVDLLSRSFTISKGEIRFVGGTDINPAFDLTLINEGAAITAYIKATGTARKPKLELRSTPELPQDEVLAMVLFGKRTSELSRFESIQLANSLRELSGFGGSSLDLLTGVRKTIGLDMLRIGSADNDKDRGSSGQAGEGNLGAPKSVDNSEGGAPTLEAGKYINDSIYVGVEQGATQESTAVRVEVELMPSLTLQGKSDSDSSEVGLGWKMDY